jgi:phosphonate transport system substrate-binding protein
MKNVWMSAVTLMFLLASFAGVHAANKKCLVMGLTPVEDPKAMIEQIQPLKAHLEKELGQCIKVFTATDYTGIIDAMRAKKLDFAWFGPFSYVLAHDRAGAEAFAVGVMARGGHTYRSYLVATPETAKQLGISTPLEGEAGMKAIKEKLNNFKKQLTFTFTDRASTSGYAVPRYFMVKVDLDPYQIFKKVGFSGTHDAAELMVKNKKVDMAADNDITYPAMVAAGKISPTTNIVIWESDPLPGSPVAYRRDLPAKTKAALKKAITTVPQEDNKVEGFGNITRWELISDGDYAMIKEVKEVIDGLKKK